MNWRERAGKKSTKGGPKRKGKPAPRRDDHSGPLISGKTHIAKVRRRPARAPSLIAAPAPHALPGLVTLPV